MTARELLEKLQALSEEEKDKKVYIFDEEDSTFFPVAQVKVELQPNLRRDSFICIY